MVCECGVDAYCSDCCCGAKWCVSVLFDLSRYNKNAFGTSRNIECRMHGENRVLLFLF